MKEKASEMTADVKWQDITVGGDWRTEKPVFDKEKCKQCLLCVPVCPDMSIPMNADGTRGDFDYFFCKGCGICASVCPFDAIHMVLDEK